TDGMVQREVTLIPTERCCETVVRYTARAATGSHVTFHSCAPPTNGIIEYAPPMIMSERSNGATSGYVRNRSATFVMGPIDSRVISPGAETMTSRRNVTAE